MITVEYEKDANGELEILTDEGVGYYVAVLYDADGIFVERKLVTAERVIRESKNGKIYDDAIEKFNNQ